MKAFTSSTLVLIPALALALGAERAASAADVEVEASFRTSGTSNVFLDRSAEPDVLFRPVGELRVDFGRFWTAGYSGQLTAFAEHPDLLSHQHELFLFANPVWGEDEENELVLEARLETLQNREAYASLNLLRPVLLARAGLEPRSFLRWEGDLELCYRWFYEDGTSSSFDALAESRLAFMLPSHTTLIAKLAYGARVFTSRTEAVNDMFDQQLEPGIRIGQGLWKGAGLQLDYGYRWLLGESGILLRKINEETFHYLGDDFMLGGHRGQLALKQLLAEAWTIRVAAAAEERTFTGWSAFTATGTLAGEDRRDLRIIPSAAVSFAWERPKGGWLSRGRVVLEYQHLIQLSNSDWYDVQADLGGIELVLEL